MFVNLTDEFRSHEEPVGIGIRELMVDQNVAAGSVENSGNAMDESGLVTALDQ